MRRIQVGDFKIEKEEKQAISEVIKSGRLTEGRKTAEFEKQFAKYIGTNYCIAVNSGTSALIAALTALKYKYKPIPKKIITTPLTFPATVNAIILSGFEPVFIDIDRKTWNITAQAMENYMKKDNGNVFGIIPVHLMGYPCKMDKIMRIAKKYKLKVIEDASQAHGTIYKERKVGSFGHLSTFSFYIAHNIQAGELGAVLTSDSELAKLVRQIKAYGRMCVCNVCRRYQGICPYKGKDFDPRFTFERVGYNFKTMDFITCIAIEKLKEIKKIIKKRQENFKYLNEELGKFPQLELREFSKNVSYLMYPILVKDKELKLRLIKELEKNGIETRPLFGCIADMPAFARFKKYYKNKLENARFIGENCFYIGCHQYITDEDLKYIVEVFKKIL